MKTTLSIAFYFAATILVSCQKKPRTPYDEIKHLNAGSVSAKINGERWVSNFVTGTLGRKEGRFHLSASLYISGLDRQGLSFSSIPMAQTLKWPLYSHYDSFGYSQTNMSDSSTANFVLSDHDVLEAFYILDTSAENFISIESYDGSKAHAVGKFQFTVFTKQQPTQGFSDTLRITNGYFEVTIKENTE